MSLVACRIGPPARVAYPGAIGVGIEILYDKLDHLAPASVLPWSAAPAADRLPGGLCGRAINGELRDARAAFAARDLLRS